MDIVKIVKEAAGKAKPNREEFIREYFIEKGASDFYNNLEKTARLSDRRAESIAESAISRVSWLNPKFDINIPAEPTDEEERAIVEFVKQNAGFGVRHPVIAGLPTLGIWPAVSRENLELRAARHLLKKHPDVTRRMKEEEEKEIERMHKMTELIKSREQEISKQKRTEKITGGALDAVGIIANALVTRQGNRSASGAEGQPGNY